MELRAFLVMNDDKTRAEMTVVNHNSQPITIKAEGFTYLFTEGECVTIQPPHEDTVYAAIAARGLTMMEVI